MANSIKTGIRSLSITYCIGGFTWLQSNFLIPITPQYLDVIWSAWIAWRRIGKSLKVNGYE